MPLFKKRDEHAGSGIDKPEPKGVVETVVEIVKSVTTLGPVVTPVAPTKGPTLP